MIDLKRLYLHYSDYPKTKEEIARKRGKGHVIKIRPTNPENTMRIKQDIARQLEKLKRKGNVEYYYVIAEIESADGKALFRPVVPKLYLE